MQLPEYGRDRATLGISMVSGSKQNEVILLYNTEEQAPRKA
jgi:hypothetical protein